MAISVKDTSQTAPKKPEFSQGCLYLGDTGSVYLYTDENSFVTVYNTARNSKLSVLYESLQEDEALVHFTGTIKITEE